MGKMTEQTAESERRKQILAEMNEAYRTLREDGSGWANLEEEWSVWDITLLDGLEDDFIELAAVLVTPESAAETPVRPAGAAPG